MTKSNTPALDYYTELLYKAEKVFDEASTIEIREEANAFAEEISEHLLELELSTAHLEACFELEAE